MCETCAGSAALAATFGTSATRGAGGFGRFEYASSASRMSLSASSCVIWPRRTMYCTRSRALSIAKPARPAAAPMTSFMAAATLLPASWLISCARAAISATVSRTSVLRMSGGTAGCDRSGGRPGIREGGVGIGGHWLVGHRWSHSGCANVEGLRGRQSICSIVYAGESFRRVISEGKYMILR